MIRLGYLGFEVADLGAWESFATDVLGLAVVDRGARGFGLRLDDWHKRFQVTQGPADDLAFLGWQAEDEQALTELIGRLRAAGVAVEPGDAAARGVEQVYSFRDPAGIPSEIFCGPQLAAEPFRSQRVGSAFVTGEQGLGHVVVNAANQQQSRDFYCDVLGFRLSDRIVANVYGYLADIVFLHANSRHHSIALGERQKKRIHHFMLEVASMDDVGLAFDRALRSGVRIMQTLGRHPNDRMLSFYARTPSGFQFEFGWGGRQVDDATWQPTTYDHISEWGHHPPQVLR
jgi:2,3-dihydroxybiphenyl 1,2-dioxygenase